MGTKGKRACEKTLGPQSLESRRCQKGGTVGYCKNICKMEGNIGLDNIVVIGAFWKSKNQFTGGKGENR